MLSEDDLNAPAVVRFNGSPLGSTVSGPTEKKKFPTLREALDWIEERLRADPTFLVFSVDPSGKHKPFFDHYGFGEEMRQRGLNPVAPTRPDPT